MKRITLILLAATMAISTSSEASEAPAEDPGLEAMAAIGQWVGDWEGEGWIRLGPVEPTEFRSVEQVESRLDGRVLIVEGTHHAKETDEIVHHALATVSWDTKAGHYSFNSHLADGKSGIHRGEMTGDGFQWGMETPDGAQIRYLIRIEGDRWDETGEYSRDGENWNQFFAMTLERQQ